MKTSRAAFLVLALAAAVTGSACVDQQGNLILPNSPTFDGSPTTPGSLAGLWTANGQATVDGCHSIQWNITNQTETTLSGTFSAICGQVVSVAGQASGTRSGQNITMQVNGVAAVQGVTTTCGFSLQGTGVIQGNDEALLVNYTGQTCLGPVSGQELLKR